MGATTRDVLHVVISSGARMITIGAVAGLALSFAAGRLVASLLFGVQPMDAVTFALVAFVVALTAAASMLAPAWRAARRSGDRASSRIGADASRHRRRSVFASRERLVFDHMLTLCVGALPSNSGRILKGCSVPKIFEGALSDRSERNRS